ncbi:MAG TPA: hypothetical protein VG387_04375 [Rhizomicrobium sp.]|jgi:hypothetical protein|nr:hypothetical protein [Rhizomicrobium sp.]
MSRMPARAEPVRKNRSAFDTPAKDDEAARSSDDRRDKTPPYGRSPEARDKPQGQSKPANP